MNFGPGEGLKPLRDGTGRFVREELMPLERRYANDSDLPDDIRRRLQLRAKELGFWKFDLSTEVGGGGTGVLGTCVVNEEWSCP